jgi:integrase
MPVIKRRRSLGSVYFHKPSRRWTYKYTVGDSRRQGYSSTKAEAEQALARAVVMVADGGITDEDPKFNDWGRAWLKSRDVADKTRESYKWMLSHMIPQVGSKRLSKLTPVMIEAAYTELLEGGLAPTSVGSVHRAFGNCIRSAHKKGLISRDVVSLCDAPRSTKRKPYVLSRVEWGRLVHASRDVPTGLLVEFLLKTGMRVDVEALSVRWSQLDLDTGFAKVAESKTAAGEGRRIPLDMELKERLRSLRREHQELKLSTGGDWNPHDFVFVNANGNRQSLTNLRTRMYKRVKSAANVPASLTFHDLRHNCGSYLLSEHVPITMVSKILGHANVAITLSIYAYALEEDTELVRQAMLKVAR